jgi:hypothetical protein
MMPTMGSISDAGRGPVAAQRVLDTGGQLAFKAAAGDEEARRRTGALEAHGARPWLWLGIAAM